MLTSKKPLIAVNHEFLINKLNHCGIRGTEQWFNMYLRERQQHPTVSSFSSKKINRHINHDLKLLNIWLRAIKIS